MVGVAGLEPAASWSRTKRDTKLRHTPKKQREKRKSGPQPALFDWRRHPDLNWGIRILQTLALPLGYGAEHYIIFKKKCFSTPFLKFFWSEQQGSNSLPPPRTAFTGIPRICLYPALTDKGNETQKQTLRRCCRAPQKGKWSE